MNGLEACWGSTVGDDARNSPCPINQWILPQWVWTRVLCLRGAKTRSNGSGAVNFWAPDVACSLTGFGQSPTRLEMARIRKKDDPSDRKRETQF